MHSKPPSLQTTQLLLAKGQSHFEQLPRGTVIRVAAGAVCLVQRTTLDHCTLVQQVHLPRGAVHCVEVPTWLEIFAQADADLLVWVPQTTSLIDRFSAWVGKLWGRLGVRRVEPRVGERCAH
jgi:hypothetical protein